MTILAMGTETETQVVTVADVFSKPGCVQCGVTYQLFIELGIDITIYNVVEDAEAHATVTELGYMQVPVIITNDGNHWSGFDTDRIKDFAARLDGRKPYERDFAIKLSKEVKKLIEQGTPKIQVFDGEIIVPEMEILVEDESELVA